MPEFVDLKIYFIDGSNREPLQLRYHREYTWYDVLESEELLQNLKDGTRRIRDKDGVVFSMGDLSGSDLGEMPAELEYGPADMEDGQHAGNILTGLHCENPDCKAKDRGQYARDHLYGYHTKAQLRECRAFMESRKAVAE